MMPVIGIDLGSAKIRWARAEHHGLKQPRIVRIGDSLEGISTFFSITEPNYTHQIGAYALDNSPSNIIFDSLRVLCSNNSSNKNEGANFYAELHENKLEQYYSIRTGQREYRLSVPEVVGALLNGIKMMAEAQLGCQITRAVLTVPSMAGTAHRMMLQQASQIAGLDTKLINQSTAAALTFRLCSEGYIDGTVLVFSMGARTTECSIFEFANYQTPKTPELCHSDGFFDFGGESFTECLVDVFLNWLSRNYQKKFAKLLKRWEADPEAEKVAKCKLRMEAEKVKAGLMELKGISILLEPDAKFGPCQFVLDRKQFRTYCNHLVEKLNTLIVDVLKQCPEDKPIGHVMLAGASSNLFIVTELLKYHLRGATFVDIGAVAPGHVAAKGAAIGAALWEAKSTGTIPHCLRNLVMPEFVYHRLDAKQCCESMRETRPPCETRWTVADVGMKLPTRPIKIICEQGIGWNVQIKLIEVFGSRKTADQIVKEVGHCKLWHSSTGGGISLWLDESGLLRALQFANEQQQTKSSSKINPIHWNLAKHLLIESDLEVACGKMLMHNKRMRWLMEEARRREDEETIKMLEQQKREEEEEEEEQQEMNRKREEEEEERRKKEEEEQKREEEERKKFEKEQQQQQQQMVMPANEPYNNAGVNYWVDPLGVTPNWSPYNTTFSTSPVGVYSTTFVDDSLNSGNHYAHVPHGTFEESSIQQQQQQASSGGWTVIDSNIESEFD